MAGTNEETEGLTHDQTGSGDVPFTGLGKEELLKYADDPSWKKKRLVLFIIFWVGWVAMLIAAIIIIVLAPRCPNRPDIKWFDINSVYQVYPKSFKDSTIKEQSTESGAGVGDLKGIQSKLSYFEKIGVKTLFISSLYKSGGQDNGMDVVDHKDIDPIYGSMQDLDALINAMKNKMRLIFDFIPNHTSSKHKWFEKSRKKEAPYTDYYIWAACNSSTKPNKWMSVHGGSAWEYDSERQECYYHRYMKQEPDLNLRNPEVKKEMEFDWMSFDTMIMVAAAGNINETRAYYGNGNIKGANFVIASPVDLSSELSAANIKRRIQEYTAAGTPKWAWSFGNQDQSRLATRAGSEMVKAMLAIQMLLPGMPVNYYGNELGMKDGSVSFDEKQDILVKDVGENDYKLTFTRDPFRTPMQWTSGANAGFSVHKPWLPVNNDSSTVNVESQNSYFSDRLMDETPLHAFRNLTKLREKESFQWGATTVGTVGESLWFKRHAEGFPGFVVVANLGTSGQTLKIHEMASVPSQMELVTLSTRSNLMYSILTLKRRLSSLTLTKFLSSSMNRNFVYQNELKHQMSVPLQTPQN